MRKLIVTNIVSIDGYYEGPGGNVMAMNMDDAFNAYNKRATGEKFLVTPQALR